MRKKIMTVAMATAMVASMATASVCPSAVIAKATKVQDTSKENYIIVCSDENEAEQVMEENEEIFTSEENVIDEETLSVSMSAEEVSELEAEYSDIQIEEDVLVSGCAKQSGSEINQDDTEWNLKMINAKGGNKVGKKHKAKRNQKVKVAIIDSGVDYSEDIDVAKRKNFIPGEDEVSILYEDGSGHGTSVAGIIAAKDNDLGITGINENVELYSAKVLDNKNVAPLSRIIEAINWAIEEKVNIINMSFGTTANSQALYNAIKKADDAGILLIASAGNNETVEYPAKYEEVVAVGSINAEGELSEQSASGDELEVVAPGEQILSTSAFDGVMACSGTSMSAPHVAGVASILWQKDMNMPADFIRKLLRSTVKDMGDENDYGYGVIDLDKALEEYDNAKKEYKYAPQNETIKVSNNTESLETYDDVEYVEGRWSKNKHMELAGLGSFTGTDLAVLKIGAKLQDEEVYGFYGMKLHPEFHGYYTSEEAAVNYGPVNYISSYILMTKIAEAYRNGKYSDPANVRGLADFAYNKICSIIGSGITTDSWNYILSGYSKSKRNKSLIVYGMALHQATDVFAHSSFTSGGKYINHKTYTNGKSVSDADDPEYCGNRIKCARAVAKNLLVHCANGTQGNVSDFAVGKSEYSFKIKCFSSYASQVNSTKYNANKAAFDWINLD